MKIAIFVSAFLCLASIAFGQRAYRPNTITKTANAADAFVDYSYGSNAVMGDAAVTIHWLDVTATNSVTVYVVAHDQSYTNTLVTIPITESATSNITFFAESLLGMWPPADTFRFSSDCTNDDFQVVMGILVTK